jgi:hypothetical protein
MSGRSGAPVRVAVAVLAACCLVALLRTVLTTPLHISLNYNEGWNAYHVAEVLRGGSPYTNASPFFFNNYPPLSFYLTAAATRVIPDPIVAGRWLSLAAFMLWTTMLARAAVLLGCGRGHAWFGALLFAASLWVFTDYVGIDDPQLIGHAVQGAAILALLRWPRSIVALTCAALACAVALFIKQTLIAAPLACVIWLAVVDRPRAWRFAAIGAVAGALGCAMVMATFGTPALAQILAWRAFDPVKAARIGFQWMTRTIVPLAALSLLLRRRPREPAVLFCGIYASIAIAVGIALGGGVGVNWNVYFDAWWAICLSAAVAMDRASEKERTPLAVALLILPALALLLTARLDWMTKEHWLTPHAQTRVEAARDIRFIQSRPGPALCEELALCFWAGKTADVDLFNTQQRLRVDPTLGDRLVSRVNARYFDVILLDDLSRDLGGAFSQAVGRNYVTAYRSASGNALTPR